MVLRKKAFRLRRVHKTLERWRRGRILEIVRPPSTGAGILHGNPNGALKGRKKRFDARDDFVRRPVRLRFTRSRRLVHAHARLALTATLQVGPHPIQGELEVPPDDAAPLLLFR